jgi:SAM-dependent methyltransferase
MEALSIRPGMTILDIGTGTGWFAYAFARRTGPTGRVFATDIDSDCINFVREEAGRRGLDNLFPVLVTRQGVDPFYGRQKYDLITVIHVRIPNAVAYFAAMREYLTEDGRLIIVVYRNTSPFSEEDFAGRFPSLIRELSLEPAESPFRRRLRESTRILMSGSAGAEPDQALRSAIVEDFNRMLSDPLFGRDFIDGSAVGKDVAFTPPERDFAEFLLVTLREEGVLDNGAKSPTPKELRIAERFNKLLFLQRFRAFLDGETQFTPGLTPEIRADFERAGYRLEKEHSDVMPFEDLLVFRPERKGGAGRDSK